VDGEIEQVGNWFEASSYMHCGAYGDATAVEGVVDNYIWLDFTKDPILKGKRLELYIAIDPTDQVRIIPVQLV